MDDTVPAFRYVRGAWEGDIAHGCNITIIELFVPADATIGRRAFACNREGGAFFVKAPNNERSGARYSTDPIDRVPMELVRVSRAFVEKMHAAAVALDLSTKLTAEAKECASAPDDPAGFRAAIRAHYLALRKPGEPARETFSYRMINGVRFPIIGNYNLGTRGHMIACLGDGTEHEVHSWDEYHALSAKYTATLPDSDDLMQ